MLRRTLILIVICVGVLSLALYTPKGGDQNPTEINQIKLTKNITEQSKILKTLLERVGAEATQESLLRSGLPFTGQTHLLRPNASVPL